MAVEQGNYNRPQRYRNPISVVGSLPTRYELKWVGGQRGKPGINADILDNSTGGAGTGETVRMITDPDFEILGTNGTSALSTFAVEGGITLTTGTTANDQMILLPHLDANQSGWKQVTWGTDRETEWECDLKIGATITSMVVWAGLKLTNTSVIATDADQAMLRYAAADGANWVAVSSNTGADTSTDTGVVVVGSKRYHLAITIDADRVARFYVNGALVETTAALKDAIDLIPYIGVQTTTTTARAITVYGQAISREAA